MKTKLLHDNEALFNHYVATHPQGDLLQTTQWGKLKESSGWNYYPLAVEQDGTIQGTALLLIKQLPIVPNTVAYSPRGPLYSSPEALLALWQAGKILAREQRALVWKMDPAILASDLQWLELANQNKLRPIDTGLDFSGVQPRFVMTLNLRSSLDTLLKNMKSKTRYNIRYAERKEVRIFMVKEKNN